MRKGKARFAMTPPRVPATLAGASRRSGASTFAVARAARARSRRTVLRCAPDGCPFRSPSLVAVALHCKRATAYADAPKGACHACRLRAPASRSRRNPSVLGEGVAPEKMVRDGSAA